MVDMISLANNPITAIIASFWGFEDVLKLKKENIK